MAVFVGEPGLVAMADFKGEVGFLAKGGFEGEVGLVGGGGPLLVVVVVVVVDAADGVCEVGEIGWALARSACECVSVLKRYSDK
jgi:hypothetical protein